MTPNNTAPELSRDEWMKRYRDRLVERLGSDWPDSVIDGAVEAGGDTYDEDPTEPPEDAVDEELSYWDNDE